MLTESSMIPPEMRGGAYIRNLRFSMCNCSEPIATAKLTIADDSGRGAMAPRLARRAKPFELFERARQPQVIGILQIDLIPSDTVTMHRALVT
jgi:hypothetical protein